MNKLMIIILSNTHFRMNKNYIFVHNIIQTSCFFFGEKSSKLL